MLIPRFAPSYTISDIFHSIIQCFQKEDNSPKINNLFKNSYCAYFSNARSGIYFLLSILPPGEVILPGYICKVVPPAIIKSGHKPIFVDIAVNELNVPINNIYKSFTKNTRALIAPHLYGLPCDLVELQNFCSENNIILLEDAAAAFGASYQGQPIGKFGDAAVFSFGKGKPLSAGRGGLLVINNHELMDKVDAATKDLLPQSIFVSLGIALFQKIVSYQQIYQWAYLFQKTIEGGNFWEDGSLSKVDRNFSLFMMDKFNFRLMMSQIKRWPDIITGRQKIAKAYKEMIQNPLVRHFKIPENSKPAWSSFPFLIDRRKDFFQYMHKNNIDLSWSFNYNIAEYYGNFNCKNASNVAGKILSLPTQPHLSNWEINHIITKVNGFK